MTTGPAATGTLGVGPHGSELQLQRRFAEPLETIWAAMTDSAQLVKWIGRWEGDPASGKVTFLMTAEGEDAPPEECEILDCSPPRSLTVQTSVGPAVWHLRFELSHQDGITTLLFAQRIGDDPLGSIGPGWEYYLDRLSAVLGGADPAGVEWNDYYPGLSAPYEALES
ncbi:SRPBCC family protein [Nesterenkonia sp. AY15]|uniref:SRPBCC family protein n=1 Tax=Nesterenkonia sp. AY15 TaxID=2901139 RepID=UPI001F4D2841|nr:SRPBCC family protein [Nesterenkonia sp. AY15]MCH8571957.1 SRPBCC family protein [Nesterenkonia sp. AY15]